MKKPQPKIWTTRKYSYMRPEKVKQKGTLSISKPLAEKKVSLPVNPLEVSNTNDAKQSSPKELKIPPP